MGDSIESVLLWHGHMNPVLLIIGGGLFWYGLNQLNPEQGV